MENLNSVCFVSKINKITPIEGADKIELAIVQGWNCIVKKGEYKQNDLVVIATTDAVIPTNLSDAMNVTNYLRKGGRVKTVKLRGVYSECLIIPLSFIPDKYRFEGSDCMELMGIFKYEPPVKMVQLSSGKKIRYSENPNFLVYYKFPNQKNVPDMFSEGEYVQITRKIHGTNARYGIVKKTKLSFWDKFKSFFKLCDEWINYEFVVGSHNVEKGSDSQGFYDRNVWYDIDSKYGIKEKLWSYAKSMGVSSIGSGVVMYGEIYGPGIQKNYDYGLTDIEFVGFDFMKNGNYLNVDDTEIVIKGILSLPHVQILYNGKWSQEVQNKYVFDNFIKGTNIPEEGIVVKSITGERNKISKVINPDYLIYSEKNNVGDSH